MRLLWTGHDWATADVPGRMPGPKGALVVDSFLADDGRVRDLEQHLERFTRSCLAFGLIQDPAGLSRFLAAARRAVPAEGRWFPRLEAHPGPEVRLVCWIREAPPASTQTRLWVLPGPDPRRLPRFKGPDLALLGTLREQARRHHADDCLLSAADGTVLEAGHSALLWWRGDVLCHPYPDLPILPSVTARRVLARARALGFTVCAERCTWSGLLDAEVWAVNALHGIRPVVGWRIPGGDPVVAPPEAGRLARFGGEARVTDTARPPAPAQLRLISF